MTVPREVVKEAWRSQDQAYDDRLNGEGQLCRDHRLRSTQHPIYRGNIEDAPHVIQTRRVGGWSELWHAQRSESVW